MSFLIICWGLSGKKTYRLEQEMLDLRLSQTIKKIMKQNLGDDEDPSKLQHFQEVTYPK